MGNDVDGVKYTWVCISALFERFLFGNEENQKTSGGKIIKKLGKRGSVKKWK